MELQQTNIIQNYSIILTSQSLSQPSLFLTYHILNIPYYNDWSYITSGSETIAKHLLSLRGMLYKMLDNHINVIGYTSHPMVAEASFTPNQKVISEYLINSIKTYFDRIGIIDIRTYLTI